METNRQVFAVMMVKDEEDIIGYNIEWLQSQDIDHFYIADNLSEDRTPDILEEMSNKYGNITIIQDKSIAYNQAGKMNRWIGKCYDMGADIIVPVDADELWYSKIKGKSLGKVLKASPEDAVFVARLANFVPHYRDIQSDNPFKRMIHTTGYTPHGSVAFTKAPEARITMGNHELRNHPANDNPIWDHIGIKHYPYRSFQHFCRKVNNGKKAIELAHAKPNHCRHWRKGGSLTPDEQLIWWNKYISQPLTRHKPHSKRLTPYWLKK